MKIIGLQLLRGYASARGTMRVLALVSTGILLMAGGGLVSPAFADLTDNYCYQNDRAINPPTTGFTGFIDDTAPSPISCTSNDVVIASATFELLDGCINALDTATFIFGGILTSNNNDTRHDIGFWFNTVGGDAELDPALPGGNGDECSVEFLADSSIPIPTDDDLDDCGDLGGKATITGQFEPHITVSCDTSAGSFCDAGVDLAFSSIITWKTGGAQNTVCSTPNELSEALQPGNGAKCNAECQSTGLEVPELLLEKECVENSGNKGYVAPIAPDLDDMVLFPGDKLDCTLTVTNAIGAGSVDDVYVYDHFDSRFTDLLGTFSGDFSPPDGPDTTMVYEGEFVKLNSFLWDIGTMIGGDTFELTFTMTMDPTASDDSNAFVCNSAQLALDNPGPAPDGEGGVATDPGPDGYINLWVDNPPAPALPGSNDPYNPPRDVIGELQSSTETIVDGCTITLAAIGDFSVSDAGGVNAIRWRTSSELGTLGFHVEWLDPASGKYVRLNNELLPANVAAAQGSDYMFKDDRPVSSKGTYRIIEVETVGRSLVHGPFETGETNSQKDASTPQASGLQEETDVTAEGGKYKAHGHQRSENMEQRLEKMRQEHEQPVNNGRKNSSLVQPDEGSSVAWLLRRGIESILDFLIPSANAAEAMKVETDVSRMHVLTAQQIADAFGETIGSVEQRIITGEIKITRRGSEIDWHQDNGTILFYAEKLSGEESQYTNNNVYWVTPEAGRVAGQLNGSARNSKSFSFREVLEIEKDVIPRIHYLQSDGDFWYQGSMTTSAGMDVTFTTPGATGSGNAVLTLRFMGTGIEADNRVDVTVNESLVHTAQWPGKGEHIVTANIDGSLLRSGEVILSLTSASGAVFTTVYLDGLTLEYDREYVAENDFISFPAGNNTAVSVSGFSSDAISVFDVSNPAATMRLTGLKPKYSKKNKIWTLLIKTEPGAEYIAYTNSAMDPVAVSSFDSQGIVTSVQNADYVVITSEELLTGAQAIADYRQGKGHETAVVTIEQIVDELNDGIPTPWAVREFLKLAWIASSEKTRFAVIAGAGNFDYRDLLPDTAGTNFVLPPLVENLYGVFGADMLSGDVEGDDGIPEIAVGRIPAFTNDELVAYRNKLQTSEEQHDGWAKRALWIADNAEEFSRFDYESDLAIAETPRYVEPVKAYLNKPYSASDVKLLITREIKKGVSIANYIGHGAENNLAAESIYVTADVAGLDNTELPVFIGLTCAITRFDNPGRNSLGQALVMKEFGGASTVWGPTGLSNGHWASGVGRAFLRAVFTQGKQTVGEAVLEALRQQGADSDLLNTHKFLQILGCPAATIR